VESGEWRVESGEWGVESGEWGVGSGEWGVESGEWRVESGEWREGNSQKICPMFLMSFYPLFSILYPLFQKFSVYTLSS